jgi:hypothetical protein
MGHWALGIGHWALGIGHRALGMGHGGASALGRQCVAYFPPVVAPAVGSADLKHSRVMGHWALGIGHWALGIGEKFPCSLLPLVPLVPPSPSPPPLLPIPTGSNYRNQSTAVIDKMYLK